MNNESIFSEILQLRNANEQLRLDNEKLRKALSPFAMCEGEDAFVDMDSLYDDLLTARKALEETDK